jgi:hypothetical protein
MTIQIYRDTGLRLASHEILSDDVDGIHAIVQSDVLAQGELRCRQLDELPLAIDSDSSDIRIVDGPSGHRDAKAIRQETVWWIINDQAGRLCITPGLLQKRPTRPVEVEFCPGCFRRRQGGFQLVYGLRMLAKTVVDDAQFAMWK